MCARMGIRICQDEVRRDRVRELGAREGVVQEEHVGCEHSPRGSISRFRKVWSMDVVGVSQSRFRPASAASFEKAWPGECGWRGLKAGTGEGE